MRGASTYIQTPIHLVIQQELAQSPLVHVHWQIEMLCCYCAKTLNCYNTPLPKWCTQACAFASFCQIAQAYVCTPFCYQFRVQKSGGQPLRILLFELKYGNALV